MTWDAALQKVRLVDLKIWQPEPDSPIDFGETFIKTLLELKERFTIRSVTYDPYQLAFAAQTLTAAGINMVELPQSEKNLTDATTSLFTLVKGRNLAVYPDERLRRQVAQAVAKETGRGWRITKEKRAHKIDAVVALAFACLGAEKEGPVTGDGADYVASANLGPWRGPSISVGGLTGERPEYDTDDAAYLRDSHLEQATWRQGNPARGRRRRKPRRREHPVRTRLWLAPLAGRILSYSDRATSTAVSAALASLRSPDVAFWQNRAQRSHPAGRYVPGAS